MRDVLEGLDSDQRSMMSELCILVDENDKPIGGASKKECHYGEGALHRAFSVLLFDTNDRLLVQKASIDEDHIPIHMGKYLLQSSTHDIGWRSSGRRAGSYCSHKKNGARARNTLRNIREMGF